MLCGTRSTFSRNDLVARFGVPITDALFARSPPARLTRKVCPRSTLAIQSGNASFRYDADTLFVPLPVLIVSFPFRIIEGLLGSDTKLNKAYSDERATY